MSEKETTIAQEKFNERISKFLRGATPILRDDGFYGLAEQCVELDKEVSEISLNAAKQTYEAV